MIEEENVIETLEPASNLFAVSWDRANLEKGRKTY